PALTVLVAPELGGAGVGLEVARAHAGGLDLDQQLVGGGGGHGALLEAVVLGRMHDDGLHGLRDLGHLDTSPSIRSGTAPAGWIGAAAAPDRPRDRSAPCTGRPLTRVTLGMSPNIRQAQMFRRGAREGPACRGAASTQVGSREFRAR